MGLKSKLGKLWQQRAVIGDDKAARELAAFLPAALEIQESPPNPVAKWVARLLISIFVIAIVWAMVSEVNVVASAEGKIIPSSRVKFIQPLSKGVVSKILVAEGQYVAKGEALVELDRTSTQADKTRLIAEMDSSQYQLAVNQALLQLLQSDPAKISKKTVLAYTLRNIPDNKKITALHLSLLWQKWSQHNSERLGLRSTQQKVYAERRAAEERYKKLEQTLPIAQQKVVSARRLKAKQYISENELLDLERDKIQQEQDLKSEEQRVQQLLAAEEEVKQQALSLSAKNKQEQIVAIVEYRRKLATLAEDLAKASNANQRQVLIAPVSGRVQELLINTIGGVVTEAQKLMVIVPDEKLMEVEVFLANKDIGFVKEQQPTEVKIHTFPFTKYGVIDGWVASISDDAIFDEKKGLMYKAIIQLASNRIKVDGRLVPLRPGMTVTAEMKTGRRKVMEFFLSPVLKVGSESIRER